MQVGRRRPLSISRTPRNLHKSEGVVEFWFTNDSAEWEEVSHTLHADTAVIQGEVSSRVTSPQMPLLLSRAPLSSR